MKNSFCKSCRSVRSWFHRYINGMKGAISLFLAICMLPFLSLAALLVESARYQSVAETLQEILDSAGMSTLADYDDYLEERFGLLATSQDPYTGGLDATLEKYITENADVLAGAADVNSVSANGAYALNDDEIFEHQILEFSEVSATTKTLVEGLNISEVIRKLEEKLVGKETKKQLENISDNTSDLANVVTAVVNLLTSVKKLQTKASECSSAQTSYENAYDTFKSKLSVLAQKVKSALEADSTLTTDKLFKKSAVKTAYNNVETARKNYYSTVSTLKTKFESYSSQIIDVYDKVDKVQEELNDANTKKTSSGAAITSNALEQYTQIIAEVLDYLEICYGNNYTTRIRDVKNELNAQKTLLNQAFDKDDVSSDWTEDASLTTWLENNNYSVIGTQIVDDMGYENVSGTLLTMVTELSSIMVSDTTVTASTSDTLSMGSYIELFTNLAGLNILYDGSLNAKVSSGYGVGSELYADFVTDGINNILTGAQNYYAAIRDGVAAIATANIFRMIDAAKDLCSALITFVEGIVDFITGILAFLADVLVGIAELIINMDELYEKFVLASYCTYNMPNRTNYKSGSGLSKYKYNNIYRLAESHTPSHGSDNAAVSLLTFIAGQDYSYDNTMFYGAELEYMVEGTSDEIGNQTSAFMAIYVWRFLMNIGSVMSSGEVQLQANLLGAASAGIGSVLVYILALFVEPLLDTILLVNGGDVFLLKDFVYCMPSGLYEYITQLNKLTSLSEADRSTITNKIKSTATHKFPDFADFENDGFLKMSYEENLMLVMMLTVDKDTLINRMQNIVSMEGITKYETDGGFALSNAYTSVYTDVAFTLNPMFNLDKLTESGLFTFHQTGYFTY